jgi:hypothetical protein
MGANDRERRQISVDRRSSKSVIYQLRCDVGDQPWTLPSELEIVCGETHRGFKSHPLRQFAQVRGGVVGCRQGRLGPVGRV